jgi:phosphate uptake regulator
MPEMEYRRLQMSKGGSFLLSLPKEWVKANGLEGGSVLRLVEGEGGMITIKAEEVAETEKGTVAVIREPDGLERQIRANYLFGADTMVIDLGKRMTPATREIVKTAIHKLIGLEIVEEEANSITVQCLLQPTSMPIKSTLKRAYVLAANMHREAELALAHGDNELALSVDRRDDEVDRLYFLIVRQLRLALRNASVSEKLGIRPSECLDLRMAAKYVETIADYAGAVASTVPKLSHSELDRDIMEALSSLSAVAYKIHEGAAQALFKQDVKLSDEVQMENASLGKALVAVNELLMSRQPRIAALLNSIAIYFYQIGAHGVDLAELVSGATV